MIEIKNRPVQRNKREHKERALKEVLKKVLAIERVQERELKRVLEGERASANKDRSKNLTSFISSRLVHRTSSYRLLSMKHFL